MVFIDFVLPKRESQGRLREACAILHVMVYCWVPLALGVYAKPLKASAPAKRHSSCRLRGFLSTLKETTWCECGENGQDENETTPLKPARIAHLKMLQ